MRQGLHQPPLPLFPLQVLVDCCFFCRCRCRRRHCRCCCRCHRCHHCRCQCHHCCRRCCHHCSCRRCYQRLLSSSHCAALLLSCASWLLRCLSSRHPLVLSLCRPLDLSSSSHCTALLLSHLTGWLLRCLSSHCPLVVLSLHCSCCLAPAGCCVASRRAALSSCRPLILSLSSHCTDLLLFHLTGWLLGCLSSHRPLVAPPSCCPLTPLLSCHLAPVGCCVASHRANFSSCRPLVLLLSSTLNSLSLGFPDPFNFCWEGCVRRGYHGCPNNCVRSTQNRQYFLDGARWFRSAICTNPTDIRGGSGRVGRGLAKETGVFLLWVMAYFLVKDTEMVRMMEIVPSCVVLVDCGVNFTLGTPRTAIPASQ